MGLHTTNNCGCTGGTGGVPPGNEFAQNNKVKTLYAGIIDLPFKNSEAAIMLKVAAKLNTIGFTITEIETPIIVIAYTQSGLQLAKKCKMYFNPGKGVYGPGGIPITSAMFTFHSMQNLLLSDAEDDPFIVPINLGDLPEGNWLEAANSAERDLTDDTKTYVIIYDQDGKSYMRRFVGENGSYGGSYPDDFIEEDFIPFTDSDVLPMITHTAQIINNGEGDSPFASMAKLNGITLSVNQATSELYLKSYNNTTLATISLAFVNNEGTTFYFNATTQKLELKNDAGEILSEVPVSSFVAGLIQYVDFNPGAPHILQFKDPTNTVVDSVTLTINNTQGLQAVLDGKANTSGSNAAGTWPISVTGNAVTATSWGGKPADLTSGDGADLQKVLGIDGTGPVKRYTNTSLKLWLAIAITDISGLTISLANMAASIAGKANDSDVIHKTGDETKTGNLSLDISNGALDFKILRSGTPAAVLGSGSGDVGLNGILRLFHTTGVENVRIYASGDSWINGGKLGIGTDNPIYKLDVNGTGNFTVLKSQTAPSANEDVVRKFELDTKQVALISGTNIKTVGGQSLLGSGNITEVQNSLTASTTLAPSVTVMNTALANKANDSDVVHNTGNETLGGVKTFSSPPVIPDGVLPTNAASVNQLNNTNTTVLAKADKVGTSDIEITDSAKGIVLKSPNGSRWRIGVTNAGAITVLAI